MKLQFITGAMVILLLSVLSVSGQSLKKGVFNMSSPMETTSANYGILNINAEKHSVLIGTVMAYGENVKGLTIKINNGFPFKLAPSQNGSTLNYVGSTLNIVLQPGDKATIEFIKADKEPGIRQLYLAGETIE